MTCFEKTILIPQNDHYQITTRLRHTGAIGDPFNTGFAEVSETMSHSGGLEQPRVASRTFVGPCRNSCVFIKYVMGYTFRVPGTTTQGLCEIDFTCGKSFPNLCINSGSDLVNNSCDLGMVPVSYSVRPVGANQQYTDLTECPHADVGCECEIEINYERKNRVWPFWHLLETGCDCSLDIPDCSWIEIEHSTEIESYTLNKSRLNFCDLGCTDLLPEDDHPVISVPTEVFSFRLCNVPAVLASWYRLQQYNGTVSSNCFFGYPPESTLFLLDNIEIIPGGLDEDRACIHGRFITKITPFGHLVCNPGECDCADPAGGEFSTTARGIGRWNLSYRDETRTVSCGGGDIETNWWPVCKADGSPVFPVADWHVMTTTGTSVHLLSPRSGAAPQVDMYKLCDPDDTCNPAE